MEDLSKAALHSFELFLAEEVREYDSVIDADLKYFETKKGDKKFPCRSDLLPHEIKDILCDISLLEPVFDATGQLKDLRILLHGTNLDHFYGSMTGKLVSKHPTPDAFNRVWQACEYCLKVREPIVVKAEIISTRGNLLNICVLYIPLSQDGENIDRFFMHNQVSAKYA